jgi:hypothetical protein
LGSSSSPAARRCTSTARPWCRVTA